MPRRGPARSVEAEAERSFQDEYEAVMERLAQEQGQPPRTTRVTQPRKVALWGLRDPNVEPESFKQILSTQGFGQEDLARMLIVKHHPELAEVYGQPVADPAVVDALTTLAEYPFRLGTYHDIRDPDERVAEAERIHRDWLRMHHPEQVTDEMADDDEAEPVVGGY